MPKKHLFGFLIYILLLAFLEHNIYAQEFIITHYTNEEGLPDQIVYDVAQTLDGKMWFGTSTGIYSYDAVDWKLVGGKTDFRRLKLDEAGRLWTTTNNTEDGLFYYSNGGWEFFKRSILPDSLKNKIGPNQLNNFDIKSKNGKYSIVKCGDYGVAIFEEGIWKIIELAENDKEIRKYSARFHNDSLFISTSNGLYVYFEGLVSRLQELPPGLENSQVLDINFYADPSTDAVQLWILGDTWLGYVENGRFFMHSTFPLFPLYGLGTINFNFLKVFPDYIFFGNQNDIFHAKKNTTVIEKLGVEEGILTQGASNVFQDYERNIWLPGFRGINKLKRMHSKSYFEKNGLLQNEVTAINQLSDSTLIFGHNSGLTFLSSNKFKPNKFVLPFQSSQIFSRVFDIFVDENDIIWIAASHIGLGKLAPGKKIKWYRHKEERFYLNLFNDGNRLWIGTNNGLLKKEGEQLVVDNLTAQEQLYIRQIKKYDDGRLLLMTLQGLFLYDGKSLEQINPGSGQLSYCALKLAPFTYLVGTSNGLLLLENKVLKKHSFANGNIENPVYFISRDKEDNLWFGTGKGVFVWDNKKLINYSSDDGLPHNETNRAAGFVDFNNSVWVGTAAGLSRFDQVPYHNYDFTNPVVAITSVTDFQNRDIALGREIELESSENNFTIQYRGYSFIDEKKSLYEVSVQDIETGVINKFTQRGTSYSFTNQLPGEYLFSVRVRNVKEEWSDEDSIKIRIKNPFYYSAWFVLLNIFFLSTFIYLIVNVFHHRKYSLKLKRQVKERTHSLLLSNRKHQIISESVDEVIWSLDANLKLDYVSPTISSVLGYSPGALLRFDKKVLVVEKLSELFSDFRLDRIRREKITIETIHKSKNGQIKYLEVVTNPVTNDNIFDGVVGVIRDITERQAREKSRAAAIIKTIENDRAKIARELNDFLGQLLASIKIRLELFQLKNGSDQNINEAQSQLIVVRGELRNIINNLNPISYIDADFISVVEKMCKDFTKRHNIPIDFTSEFRVMTISEETKLMLLRILQEALNNIHKHSGAHLGKVSFLRENDRVQMLIQDDGRGFNFEYAFKTKGLGLRSIYQRASIIGGIVKIESNISGGTKIKLSFKENHIS